MAHSGVSPASVHQCKPPPTAHRSAPVREAPPAAAVGGRAPTEGVRLPLGHSSGEGHTRQRESRRVGATLQLRIPPALVWERCRRTRRGRAGCTRKVPQGDPAPFDKRITVSTASTPNDLQNARPSFQKNVDFEHFEVPPVTGTRIPARRYSPGCEPVRDWRLFHTFLTARPEPCIAPE